MSEETVPEVVTADVLRNAALGNDTRNASCLTDAVLWLAAEVRELRLAALKEPADDSPEWDDEVEVIPMKE